MFKLTFLVIIALVNEIICDFNCQVIFVASTTPKPTISPGHPIEQTIINNFQFNAFTHDLTQQLIKQNISHPKTPRNQIETYCTDNATTWILDESPWKHPNTGSPLTDPMNEHATTKSPNQRIYTRGQYICERLGADFYGKITYLWSLEINTPKQNFFRSSGEIDHYSVRYCESTFYTVATQSTTDKS